MKITLQGALAILMLMPVLYSCASYNKSMGSYYDNLRVHNYEKAKLSLEQNKQLKKQRNALLFNLEMGKILRLQNNYASSNLYLNAADDLMESTYKSFGDIVIGNVANPMRENYKGEDHEKFMMHYYKALNYAALGKTEDAVVEARRITLSNYKQEEKFTKKDNRYLQDAFSLNLQGMIYEMAGDINNAFIAYRNAAELYSKNNNEYYGVALPKQLENDLIRTSNALGFSVMPLQQEQVFNISYKTTNTNNGELILFLEEGHAPIKEENNFFLTATKDGINSFNFVDANGYSSNFNFNNLAYGISDDKLASIRTCRLALPTYKILYTQPQNIIVSKDSINYKTELVQNLNSITTSVLRERFVKEMGNALARQLTKKLLEKGTEALAEGVTRSTDKRETTDTSSVEKEKSHKKKEDRIKNVGNIAGLAVNIFNATNEKADTRNWQSLPAFVHYVRIPLHAGENTITVSTNGVNKTIKVNGGIGLQMVGLSVQ
jgi:uncharacterized protein